MHPVVRVEQIDELLASGFQSIRSELDIEDTTPADALAEAGDAARRGPRVAADDDLRELPFVTIDPPGSRDLDQALCLERNGTGWVVQYAIADVGAFVRPGGALDQDTRGRGVTVYLPDHRSPLHPSVLSEGAASLLPDEERQAVVYRIAVDASGDAQDVDVRRARVRSRRAYNYQEVQDAVDARHADEQLQLLRAIGEVRIARQVARGGLDLRLPEQVVVCAAGTYELVYRAPLPAESWNAQLSLLTGECAATLMLDAGVGILRTLPPPSPDAVARLRRHAHGLGVRWPDTEGYAPFLASLDPTVPDHAALIVQSSKLARGAGYVAFTGHPDGDVTHSAVTAPYAHVTAPLRRLADRFGNEIALAACAGTAPPEWATTDLATVAELMDAAHHRQVAADRMAVELVEAAVLSQCIGSEVTGVVVNVNHDRATVQLRRPAVVADTVRGRLQLGEEVELTVTAADVATRHVELIPQTPLER